MSPCRGRRKPRKRTRAGKRPSPTTIELYLAAEAEGRVWAKQPCATVPTEEGAVLESLWTQKESSALVQPYIGVTGPRIPVDSTHTALDLFSRYFTDDIWDLLVTETNRYAASIRSQNTHTHPRPWYDVTMEEMKAFIGVVMLMGICRLPTIEMYWSANHPLITPGISNTMPRIRFEQILRFLHLNDNAQQVSHGQPGYDPLFKVRPLLDLLSRRFESEYTTHEEVSIDEAMIPYKGRLGFKQYMKDKPTKWGIKAFVLADARNGYVKRFQVYTGKNAALDASQGGLCTRVVLELLSGLEGDHPKLYVDNYYTSPTLFLRLYKRGVNACGTARSNSKHYPKTLAYTSGGLQSGFYDYRSSGPLLAAVWVDKRVINFLSTMHVAETPSPVTVQRRTLIGSRVEVEAPPLLPDYQAYMRGVDRGDQLIGYYNIGRRSKKWWRRVFAYLVEVAALNAFVLFQYTHTPSSRKDYLQFRLRLAEELVGSFSSPSADGSSSEFYPWADSKCYPCEVVWTAPRRVH